MKLGELHSALGEWIAKGVPADTEVLIDLPGESLTVYIDGGCQQYRDGDTREILLVCHSVVGEETDEEEGEA